MASLLDRLRTDLNASRKAQDKPRTLLLGMVLSDLGNREIEVKRALADDDVVEILRKSIKRRKESITAFDGGNRPELAEKERSEVAILETYLPAAVDDSEIRAAVREAIAAGAANVGVVMGKVMPRFKGKADGGTISAIAKDELAKASGKG